MSLIHSKQKRASSERARQREEYIVKLYAEVRPNCSSHQAALEETMRIYNEQKTHRHIAHTVTIYRILKRQEDLKAEQQEVTA